MKKRHLLLFLLASVLLFAGCTKEQEPQPKKYSVTNNVTYGYSTTLTIFECNEVGDKIKNVSEKFSDGETKTYTAEDNAVKIKIYVKAESIFGDVKGWVQQVYYLQEGSTKSIVVDDNTIVGSYEP